MLQKLTPAFVANPPVPTRGRAYFWEGGGLGLMVTSNGAKSFVVQYRTIGRQSRRMTLKKGLTLIEARREAKAIIGAVAKGGDPLGERRKAVVVERDTLRAVCEEFLPREGGMARVDGKVTFSGKMRTANQWEADLGRLVYPVLGGRPIGEIRKLEVIRLVDDIRDTRGPHMAVKTHKMLTRIFNWYAGRSDDFRPPVIRIGRIVEDVARERTLTNDELRVIWRAAEAFQGPYGSMVRFVCPAYLDTKLDEWALSGRNQPYHARGGLKASTPAAEPEPSPAPRRSADRGR